MKWIGQHIYDQISRFRDDVYLEDISTGTIASGGHLGLDSNNKIVKAVDGGGDLTSIVAGTGLSGTSLTGPIPTLNVDASQTQITAVGTIATGVWQGTTIKTAYIGDDQVTEDKLANTLLAEIDANTAKATNVATNLSQSTGTETLRIESSDGTNVIIAEASGSIAGLMTVTHHDKLDAIEASATADQSKSDIDGLAITTVGTIDTGVWNATAIASAKMATGTSSAQGALELATTAEATTGTDTARAVTPAGLKAYADRPAKQIVLMRAAFKDDIGTTKHYIPLQSELEQTNSFHEMNSFVAPFDGKLLKLMYNGSGNFSGGEFSFTLEQIPRNVAFATTPTVLETIAIDGPTNDTTDPNMIIANFVGGSGTNSFTAGDLIMVGIQSDADVTSSTSKHFFTLVFEFDFSSLA